MERETEDKLGEWEPEPRLVRPKALSEDISLVLGDIKAAGYTLRGGSVGTTRRAGGVRAAIGVLSDRSGKIQTWEAQTRGG
jgi:hypothetical protein